MRLSGTHDEVWFTGLYAAHYPDIVRYGLRRLGDAETSAELAQEVFAVAWRRRTRVPDHALPWLYGVARRLLANDWRRRRARPAPVPLLEADAVPERGGSVSDTVAAIADLRRALATLSGADQEILRLVGWEQLTVGEAATTLGCSRTAAAVRLHRARHRLTAALAKPSPIANAKPAAVRGY